MKKGAKMKFKLLKKQQKQTNNKEKSHGRSMVEMLGVLAIIGVLSIGGIQGYTIAMRKHRANEILNALQKYAISYYTKTQQRMLNDDVTIKADGWWITGDDDEWVGNTMTLLEHIKDNGGISTIDSLSFNGVRSTNSGDFVFLSMNVKDEEVCKILINTTGDTRESMGLRTEQCLEPLEGMAMYTLYLAFPMN